MPEKQQKQQVGAWRAGGGKLRHTLEGHEKRVFRMAWSPRGELLAAPSADASIRVWDARTGESLQVLQGHRNAVHQVAWSPTAPLLASVSEDGKATLWNTETWVPEQVLTAHTRSVVAVAWSPDGTRLVTGDNKGWIRCWDARTGQQVAYAKLVGPVFTLAWSPDGSLIAAGTLNNGLYLLGSLLEEKNAYPQFGSVFGAQWTPTGHQLAIAGVGTSISILNLSSTPMLSSSKQEVEGHTAIVKSLSFSPDGRLMASLSTDGELRLWETRNWSCVDVLGADASSNLLPPSEFSPDGTLLAVPAKDDTAIQIWELNRAQLLGVMLQALPDTYANAKVVLVGDSGVGKSGLGLVLSGQPFAVTESSHARSIWLFEKTEAQLEPGRHEQREVLLWDLAGQPGYRVFHRQHLDEVAVALVLFDSRSETDPFAGVAFWARALDSAARGFPLVKYLVASRVDRGGPAVSRERIQAVCAEYGFQKFFEVSARRGDGLQELDAAIRSDIAWSKVPRVISPRLFHDMRSFVVAQKEQGRVLSRRLDLLQQFAARSPQRAATEEEFSACLGRLEVVGLIKRLTFGDLVLLQPELLDAYGGWLALAARAEPDGLGFIPERKARQGAFPMDDKRLLQGHADEALLITATIEDIVSRGIALRQPTEQGEMLVFPSELRTELPHYPGGYSLAVRYNFKGPVKEAYAALVVWLTHSPAFSKKEFFRNAALFHSAARELCGVAVDYPDPQNEGRGRITVFFEAGTGLGTKLTFLRYVTRQLETMAFEGNVERERIYQCDHCGKLIDPADVAWRQSRGETTALCGRCGRHLPIDDLAERGAEADPLVDEQIAQGNEERERQTRLVVLSEREARGDFHLFLCHNSKDKEEVRRLAATLRDEGILPWMDERGVLAGGQIVPELERVIDRAPAAAVIVGPHSMGPWQRQEYYAILQRFIEHREESGRKRLVLIPTLLPGAPKPEELPRFLRGFSWVDFRTHGLDNRHELRKLVNAVLSEGMLPTSRE
jgi:GTPase SAR1 family protein